MDRSTNKQALVAVDLGAQSCRVSLLRWREAAPEIQVIHRFPNAPVPTENGLRWDIRRILDGVMTGLRICADAAPQGIACIGIDGWGVDYVRLDREGKPIGDPYCHRDERTTQAMKQVFQRISPERLYALTGIQILGLNTIFQLYADQQAGIDADARWLSLPEYVSYVLGGRPVSEYTNATHTQLVTLGKREWCDEIFEATGLVLSAAPEIVAPGTVVGRVRRELSRLTQFSATKLIVPACHDTASAIAAIPASGDDSAFISSGTWSLVGTVLASPCVSESAREMNFTNLGGVGGTICFLKNVNGMWLLRQCMDEWEQLGFAWKLEALIRCCEQLPAPRVFIDVDEAALMQPGNMVGKINAQLKRAGASQLEVNDAGIPAMANVIFHSLAKRYADVLASVARITKKKLRRLFVVGGGSKNDFLNRLTASCTGLEVIPGSSECTTIGNFAIQIAALEGYGENCGGVSADTIARHAEALASHCLTFSRIEERQANLRSEARRQEV
jgi:rhamnulokinase